MQQLRLNRIVEWTVFTLGVKPFALELKIPFRFLIGVAEKHHLRAEFQAPLLFGCDVPVLVQKLVNHCVNDGAEEVQSRHGPVEAMIDDAAVLIDWRDRGQASGPMLAAFGKFEAKPWKLKPDFRADVRAQQFVGSGTTL